MFKYAYTGPAMDCTYTQGRHHTTLKNLIREAKLARQTDDQDN